ncbi:hypothetical protein BLOT_002197 [Blomia tropicalis]|nr:hypothetical protein BLOT_002197 [Blomia tropicalis]
MNPCLHILFMGLQYFRLHHLSMFMSSYTIVIQMKPIVFEEREARDEYDETLAGKQFNESFNFVIIFIIIGDMNFSAFCCVNGWLVM